MTTSLEIEPVMNMSNSAEMTTVGGGGRAASNSFGAAAMRCELRPTLDTIGKHASFISNDESQIVTFYSYFGSHKL